MDEHDYHHYWTELREEVSKFRELDDFGVVFGARTRDFGHAYEILPRLSEKDLSAFEKRTGQTLPLEYRTYLLAFGAGGAGPDYGIYDFNACVRQADLSVPFPVTVEEFAQWDDYEDDDPIWDLPGAAYICSHGCGIESAIEINGPDPGSIWCLSGVNIFNLGSFQSFYDRCAEKTRLHLMRYDLLKTVVDRRPWTDFPKGISFDSIVEILGHEHREFAPDDASYVPEGEIWVYFKDTPGKLILNDRRELIKIEPMTLS